MQTVKLDIEQLKWDSSGLLPAIVQDAHTLQVLTLAYMNREALAKTLDTGEIVFWSRSRQELWHKGATSGNTQRVVEIRPDCDADALLILVEPAGPACHTGAITCFYRNLNDLA
jgi:phosphoribosyl-AMP cyclohydrolase / phosphoribosyl-ATP pyrophosphohydrolase